MRKLIDDPGYRTGCQQTGVPAPIAPAPHPLPQHSGPVSHGSSRLAGPGSLIKTLESSICSDNVPVHKNDSHILRVFLSITRCVYMLEK